MKRLFLILAVIGCISQMPLAAKATDTRSVSLQLNPLFPDDTDWRLMPATLINYNNWMFGTFQPPTAQATNGLGGIIAGTPGRWALGAIIHDIFQVDDVALRNAAWDRVGVNDDFADPGSIVDFIFNYKLSQAGTIGFGLGFKMDLNYDRVFDTGNNILKYTGGHAFGFIIRAGYSHNVPQSMILDIGLSLAFSIAANEVDNEKSLQTSAAPSFNIHGRLLYKLSKYLWFGVTLDFFRRELGGKRPQVSEISGSAIGFNLGAGVALQFGKLLRIGAFA